MEIKQAVKKTGYYVALLFGISLFLSEKFENNILLPLLLILLVIAIAVDKKDFEDSFFIKEKIFSVSMLLLVVTPFIIAMCDGGIKSRLDNYNLKYLCFFPLIYFLDEEKKMFNFLKSLLTGGMIVLVLAIFNFVKEYKDWSKLGSLDRVTAILRVQDFSNIMCIILLFLLSFLIFYKEKKENMLKKISLFVMILLVLFIVLVGRSKMVYVSLLPTIFYILLKKRKKYLLVFLVLCAVGYPLLPTSVTKRVPYIIKYNEDPSSKLRVIFWGAGIEELKEKQQEKQQELKDATKDLGDLEKKIKEKKEKRDLLLREIDDKEIKRSNLESVVKNLEDRREHLDLDIEKITKEQEAVKYKIVSSHEEEAKQEIEKLNKKIEKTYSYRINGNDSTLNSEIENKFFQEIENNSFRYSNASSDVRLEINVDMVYFYPEDVDMKSFPKQYTENYKDSNGKDNTNIVSYSENIFKKTTSMGVRLNYRLVSNLTGEVIFNGSKNFDKEYEKKWKTYFIISDKIFNRDRLPKDENEKSVPSKKKIIEDITKEILNTIDADFHKLP